MKTGASECTHPGCPFVRPHYHVEDAEGERIVWTAPPDPGLSGTYADVGVIDFLPGPDHE